MKIAFFGSSLVSAYWNGAATYYRGIIRALADLGRFADALASGTHEVEYQARATIDGTFTAMPATIEQMYTPDVRGRTARATITVTK